MPNKNDISVAVSIITQAILDQFNIKDKGTHIAMNLEESMRMCFVQAYGKIQYDSEGKSKISYHPN